MSSTVCSRCQADISSGSLTPKSRPEYLERVNPLHADIPSLPERYSESSDHYWYFGFPVSIEEARALVKHYASWMIREPASDMNYIINLHQVLAVISEWDYIAIVNVQPEEESAPEEGTDNTPTPSASAVDGRPAEERYSEDSEYYWYYGFALSLQEIRDLAQHHPPQTLETPDGSTAPDLTLITGLLLFCMAKTGWDFISQVLVQPVPKNADIVQTLYPAPNGQPTVFFFSVMATQDDMLATRPSQVQIDELVKILKKEPEWREDAIPKSDALLPYSDYYWHFGFTVSIAEVRSILGEWAPSRVRMSPTDDADMMSCLLVVTSRIWPFTKLFDAQPEEGSADNVQSVLETLYDRRAVSIYSLMSTETEHFVSRPGSKELKALTALFGKQPVWREDAIEKEMWADYYDEHYDD
ncbi:hypothetical protein EV121DRAFT_271194 [Schizophyllum commune]